MDITIFHNPRCSKSRRTLELLEERDPTPQIINYLDTPPDHARLNQILELLEMQPRELMRTHEVAYKENRLDDPNLSRDALIEAMVRHPVLIERPIVIANGMARIGRPPESVLEIL